MIFLHLHFQKHTIISMKKHLLIILFSATFFQLSAQEYNLNNFKYRYQQYKSLEFNYNTSGKFSHQNYSNKYTNSNLNFIGTANLANFYNTDSKSKSEQLSLNTSTSNTYQNAIVRTFNIDENGFSPIDNPYTDRKEISNSVRNALSLGYSNSTTKFKGKKFINYYVNNSFSTENVNITYKDSLKQSIHQLRNSLSLGIGAGKGRLEYINDAVTAQFLLEDLKKSGLIASYSDEQVENLAKGIVQARNKRFLPDYRFTYIDQISLVDSVCKANKIVSDNSLKYLSILYDNFMFANSTIQSRQSGKVMSHNISFSPYYDNMKMTKFLYPNFNITPYYNLNLAYTFYYKNSRQINLKTQRSYSVSYQISNTWQKDHQQLLNESINITYNYLFQPNSRTYLTAGCNFSTWYNLSKQNLNYQWTRIFEIGTNTTLKYFFSRRLMLTASANWSSTFYNRRYSSNNSASMQKPKDFNHQANFDSSISYYLF